MKETWNEPTAVRCELPPDRVAQLLEERSALMAKVREIDDQMNAIGEMVAKWAEIARAHQ